MTQFTLKNIKYSEFASEETFCFEATVYRDGKSFCIASNGGKGGSTNHYPIKGGSNQVLQAAIIAIDKKLEDTSLESIVFDLMADWLTEKDIRRILRKIAYIKDDGLVYTKPPKFKPNEANLKACKLAPWWRPSFIMLNGMSMVEIKKLPAFSA